MHSHLFHKFTLERLKWRFAGFLATAGQIIMIGVEVGATISLRDKDVRIVDKDQPLGACERLTFFEYLLFA